VYKNPVFLFELKGGAVLFYGIPKQRVPCEFPLSEIGERNRVLAEEIPRRMLKKSGCAGRI